ncbi:MAG: T9SS type A sorting domain-containing protein [Polaribacter sp.]
MLGKRIMTINFDGKLNNIIPLPNLATGIYIVKLQTEDSTKTKKIIIE